MAEVVMGQSPPGETVIDWDGDFGRDDGLPFIQGNAEFGVKSPRPLKWCVQPVKVAYRDDLMISVRAPVGQTNRASAELSIGRGLAAIRFSEPSQAFGWHIVNHTKGTLERVTQGSTFQAIGGEALRSLPILLPPLSEQQAIAAVLDSIDDAIERTEAVITATERVRDALLHRLLTRGVPGWHTEWKNVPGVGTIPASWEVVRLGDVAALRGAYASNRHKDQLPYIGLEHVANGGYLLEYGSESDFISTKTRFFKGDTLYGKLRPNLRKVLRAPFDGTCTTEILALYGNVRLDSGFLSYVLRRDPFHRYAMSSITGDKDAPRVLGPPEPIPARAAFPTRTASHSRTAGRSE